MKINKPQPFTTSQSESINFLRMATPAKRFMCLSKDGFRREATLAFSRSLSDQSLAHADLVIDISCSDHNKLMPWWSKDLEALLPDLPPHQVVLCQDDRAKSELYDALKLIAKDKSYLRANLDDLLMM
jgi:hypothetical protein